MAGVATWKVRADVHVAHASVVWHNAATAEASLGTMQAASIPGSVGAADGATHLERMLRGAVADLGEVALEGFRALSHSLACSGGVLQVGTLFSGCDIGIHVVKSLLAVLNGVVGGAGALPAPLRLAHAFSCEIVEWKADFIRRWHKPRLLFANAEHLAQSVAPDCISGQLRAVPRVHVLLAGFVCKDMSTLSSRHRHFQARITEGEGVSSQSFLQLCSYVRAHRPAMVFIENVPGISHARAGPASRRQYTSRGQG
jgi:hypothetical protein